MRLLCKYHVLRIDGKNTVKDAHVRGSVASAAKEGEHACSYLLVVCGVCGCSGRDGGLILPEEIEGRWSCLKVGRGRVCGTERREADEVEGVPIGIKRALMLKACSRKVEVRCGRRRC